VGGVDERAGMGGVPARGRPALVLLRLLLLLLLLLGRPHGDAEEDVEALGPRPVGVTLRADGVLARPLPLAP